MPKAYGLMALITAFACGGVMKLYVDIVYDGNGSQIWGNSVEEYFFYAIVVFTAGVTLTIFILLRRYLIRKYGVKWI